MLENKDSDYFESEDVDFSYCSNCGHSWIPKERDPDGIYQCPNCKNVVTDNYY